VAESGAVWAVAHSGRGAAAVPGGGLASAVVAGVNVRVGSLEGTHHRQL
jgi:hypothetical protein